MLVARDFSPWLRPARIFLFPVQLPNPGILADAPMLTAAVGVAHGHGSVEMVIIGLQLRRGQYAFVVQSSQVEFLQRAGVRLVLFVEGFLGIIDLMKQMPGGASRVREKGRFSRGGC